MSLSSQIGIVVLIVSIGKINCIFRELPSTVIADSKFNFRRTDKAFI